jgi:hypothetical protein
MPQMPSGANASSIAVGAHEAACALPNVWLGVSVENQHFADERIPLLLQTPAAVRFISAEPLLGPVDLDWNDSRDEVLRQRAKAKERMDRHRGKRTFPRVVNGAMNTICNAVADALRTTNDSANETDHEQVSTYHVPRYVQKQEREDASAPERDTERIQRLNERIRQHRRRRSHETDDGRPRLSVIAALARTVLQTHPDETDDGELRELLKAACARVNLQHDGRSVGDALEQAKAQLRRTS